MSLIDIVKNLEGKSDRERMELICSILRGERIDFERDPYSTGENIIVYSGMKNEIGVGSHFDKVSGSPGANDNASAVAVSIDILRRVKAKPLKNIGVRGFFFDQEEEDLTGSLYYARTYDISGLIGLYNMEMVGCGDKLALWWSESLYEGRLVKTFEETCHENGVLCFRFPDISKLLRNTGDHQSFNLAGLKEAFCITAISDDDLKVAAKYLGSDADDSVISERAYSEAPLFSHYHKPSDKSEHLNDKTLQMVSDLLYESICKIDANF